MTPAGPEPQNETPGQPSRLSIEKYLPWLRYSDKIIGTLKTLGLGRDKITTILSGGEVTMVGEIVNPEDMRPLMVSSAKVRIEVKDHGMTCRILIDEKTVENYFHDYYNREVLMREAGVYSEVVARMYEENQELRRLLAGGSRVYK